MPASYLAEWLFDIGPTLGGGMSDAALGYRDFAAWQEVTGLQLMPWEAATLRKMSQAYLAERLAGADSTRAAPFSLSREDARGQVDARLRSMFGNLKKA